MEEAYNKLSKWIAAEQEVICIEENLLFSDVYAKKFEKLYLQEHAMCSWQ